jgi:uncharacterized membrane protein YfcA
MLEPELLVFAMLVIFIAGITQSLTGFGFGLVAIPLLTLFMSPKLAPPVVLLDGLVLNLLIMRRAYPAVTPNRIWLLTLAGLCGVPIGVWILANWDVDALRIYIGVMTCLAAGLFLKGFHHEIRNEKAASVPIGFVSGIMSGSINMSGPPIILFFANQNLPRQVFRANIVAYFIFLQLAGIPLMIASGLMNLDAAATSGLLLPALILGGLVGASFADKVDDLFVRRVTLIVVSLAGLLSVLNGVGFL